MKLRYAALVLALAVPAFADKKLDEAVTKANEQFQKGKPEEAVKTLEKLASQNPPSAEAYLALSRIQERVGGDDGLTAAGESLTKAAAASTSAPAAVRADVLAAQAALSLHRSSGKEALAQAEAAAKAADPQPSPAVLAVLARAQARAQDPVKGLETADRAVQAAATSAVAHEARGEALLALRRTDDAIAAFRKALEVDAKLNAARNGLATALLTKGKPADALAEARKAADGDQKDAEAFAVLGSAILEDNAKNWNDAIAQAQQGAFLNPRSPLVQVAVGDIFNAADNLDQAVTAYRKALETDPAYGPARVALVRTQLRRGDPEGAFAEAKKLAADVPQSGEAQLLYGKIMLRRGDYAGAADALQKAATLTPGSAETQALLGTADQYVHKSPEALAAYKRATELEPGNLEYRSTYGLLLGVAKQSDAGIAELKKVVQSPGYKDAAGYINLGWLYRNTDPRKTEESIAAYKKALEIDPQSAPAALGLAWAYSYSRLWDEAIASYKKTMVLDAHMTGDANLGIAWCYFFKKELVEAKAYLDKAQAAGANTRDLRDNIDRLEKAIARRDQKAMEELARAQGPKDEGVMPSRGPDLPTLINLLKNGDVNTRKRAASELRGKGPDAVPYLAFALRNEKERAVREAIVTSLAGLGPAAKDALPALLDALAQKWNEKVVMTPAEMQESMKEEDLKRVIRDLVQKLQGK